MTITYSNGTMVEGLILVCTDGLMRVALRGGRDAVEFIAGPDGIWLSESGEPVQIGHQPLRRIQPDGLDEFICPEDVMHRVLASCSTCVVA